MDGHNFEICIRIFCVDKNVRKLFCLLHKSCTERGTHFYASVQKFKFFPSKQIFHKLICDTQKEDVKLLNSQFTVGSVHPFIGYQGP